MHYVKSTEKIWVKCITSKIKSGDKIPEKKERYHQRKKMTKIEMKQKRRRR